jgi:hypothetical protein
VTNFFIHVFAQKKFKKFLAYNSLNTKAVSAKLQELKKKSLKKVAKIFGG